MQVAIGSTSNQSPQPARFVTATPGSTGAVSSATYAFGTTCPAGTPSGAYTYLGTYEGLYEIPAGQTLTRFTFKNYDPVSWCDGNFMDDIVFTRAFKLEYDVNGGTGIMPQPSYNTQTVRYSQYYTSGTSVTLTDKKPSRSGCTFMGWSYSQKGICYNASDVAAAGIISSVTMPSNNVKLYAVWAHNPTITFKNGHTGANISSTTVTYGTGKSAPTPPAVTGYTFKNWTVQSGSSNYSSSITEDTVVIANYEPNPYKVRFNKNLTPWRGTADGTMADQNMVYDTEAALNPNRFSAAYYYWRGWNSNPNGSGRSFADQEKVKNLTATANAVYNVYAQWEPHPIMGIRKVRDASDGEYNITDDVTYTLTATQTVPGATAHKVTFTDNLAYNNTDMVAAGATLDFDSIKVTGPSGQIPASNIQITRNGTKGFTAVVTADVAKDQSLVLTYKVHLGNTDTVTLQDKTWYNQASAIAEGQPSPEPAQTASTSFRVRKPKLTVSKDIDDTIVDAGDTVTYTFTATNTGDAKSLAYNVCFTDVFPRYMIANGAEILFDQITATNAGRDSISELHASLNGSTLEIKTDSDILAGTSLIVKVPVKLGDRGDIFSSMTFENYLRCTCDNADPDTDDQYVIITDPKINTYKSADKTFLNTSESAEFTVVAINETEDSRAYNVTVNDKIADVAAEKGAYIVPSTLKFTDTIGNMVVPDRIEWTYTNGKATGFTAYMPGYLGYRDKFTATYTLYAGETSSIDLENGLLPNIAWASSSNGGDGLYGHGNLVVMIPSLQIQKETMTPVVNLGDVARFRVTVTQNALDATAWNVSVTDMISQAMVAAGAYYDPDSFKVSDAGGNAVECSPVISSDKTSFTLDTPIDLGYRESMTVEYGIRMGKTDSTGLQGSNWENLAIAQADNTQRAMDSSSTVWVPSPAIKVSKTADKGSVNAGGDVTFTFTATQYHEDAVAYNAVFEDRISPALKAAGGTFDTENIVVESPQGTSKPKSATVSGDGTLLRVETDVPFGYQESVVVKVPFTFGQTTSPLASGAIWQDDLTVTTDNAGSGNDSARIEVKEPRITVSKESSVTKANTGDRIPYTLTVSNTEPGSVAYGAYVADDIAPIAVNAGARIDRAARWS